MSTTDIVRPAGTEIGATARASLKPFWIAAAALVALAAGLRVYQEIFGWRTGLDFYAPEFQSYWGVILQGAAPIGLASTALVVGYLWRTRDRKLDALSPAAEMRRLQLLVQWLAVFGLAIYLGLSFFTEQTAVWHMTAVRDTAFTPSNLITFYISYPLFAIIGIGAFFYAKTRLPLFARGYSVAFLVLVVGMVMTIPTVGLNEWGCTFWLMEEIFASPLHWGFVFFGWMALAVFGVALTILGRIRELLGPDGVSIILGR